MILRSSICALVSLSPLALSAATPEQEYQQVRTIALRDPKVRAAYEDADRRLEEKILKIDPALAGYLRHRGSGPVEKPAPVQKPFAGHPQPAQPPAAKRPASTAPAYERSHVVLKGETLSSIASIFGVTAESIKKANHIEDERKLAVGQQLAIPDRVR